MKGKTWLQKYLMEKSKPEQTKPLQNHQQKYERIHSQSTIIIRESVKTEQKSTPIEADEEYTINVPQNNSPQLGGQEIGQLSFLSSNQPRNASFSLSPLKLNSPLSSSCSSSFFSWNHLPQQVTTCLLLFMHQPVWPAPLPSLLLHASCRRHQALSWGSPTLSKKL